MHIGKKNYDNSYSLHRKSLEKVIEEKDIGIVIDSDLTFEKHINEKVNKANQMFATLRRTFQFMDKSTFVQLYKSLVRTHLDYASSVWAPFKAKHIEQIEWVQRRATKQIPGFRDMTYSERLRALKLPLLSYRRLRRDMIEVYKILNGKYDQDACTILKLWKDMTPRSSIRGNSLKLYHQRARTQLRKYSFAMRVVKYWNSLPEKIITSKTLNTFKNRLDKHWEDQDLVYEDFKADIKLEGRDVDFNMSEEEIESGIEEPLDPALENIAMYR
jgi:hypothetical protein